MSVIKKNLDEKLTDLGGGILAQHEHMCLCIHRPCFINSGTTPQSGKMAIC